MTLTIDIFSKSVTHLTTPNVDLTRVAVQNKINRINLNIDRYKKEIDETEIKINMVYSKILKLFVKKEAAEQERGFGLTLLRSAALGAGVFLIGNDLTLLSMTVVGCVCIISCAAWKKCYCPEEKLLQQYTQDNLNKMIQSAKFPSPPPVLPIPPFWMNSNNNNSKIDQNPSLTCEEIEQKVCQVREAAQKMLGELKVYRNGLSGVVQSMSLF